MNEIQKQQQNQNGRDRLAGEMRKSITGYITAAFGLVAGLAWNDAIRSAIEHIFPLQKNSILMKFVYASIMTIVLVVVTVYFLRIFKQER